MAAVFQPSAFLSEPTLLASRPTTPPYPPTRNKRRFERADSPASFTSSIHPVETESPAKKASKRSSPAPSNIKVEELTDADLRFLSNIDVVHPYELEDADSDAWEECGSSSDDHDDEDDDLQGYGIASRLSRMRCDDNGRDALGQTRHYGFRYRMGSRIFKRSHSQSVKADSGKIPADEDAMDDQDNLQCARRLRRRVGGPIRRKFNLKNDTFGNSPNLVSTFGESNGNGQSRGYESASMVDESSDDDDDDDDDDYDLEDPTMKRGVTGMDVDDDSE